MKLKHSDKFLYTGLLILIVFLIIAVILLCTVPPVDRDALTHHLFVPKLWIKHGSMYEIPEIPFSYYPMNLDLLYSIPLMLGNDIISKYIHFLFALLTACLVYKYLNKRMGKVHGAFGALFFLSVPIIIKLSITVYVDLGVVFFTTASLLLLLYWAEQHFPWHLLILSGLSCGLAAGTKYNGLISIITLTFLVPLIYQQSAFEEQRSNRRAIFSAIIFAVASLIAFSPWLIRNTLWTGNPIYPLHKTLIQRIKPNNSPQIAAEVAPLAETLKQVPRGGGGVFAERKFLYHETWWQALILPIRFFTEGQDDSPQYFDGKLTPFLLILPFIAFLFRPEDKRQRREQNFLLWFGMLYFFFTFFQESLRIRYVAPIVPPLVLLALYGLQGLQEKLRQFCTSTGLSNTSRFLASLCVPVAMLCYNGQYLTKQFTVVKPLTFLLGHISRDDYITAFRPEYPAIQFANSIVPEGDKALCIFLGNRGYYMDFTPTFEQPYEPGSILARFLSTNDTPGQSILNELRQQHISHVLLRTDLTAQWLQQLNDHDFQRLAPLFSETNPPLWNGNGHIVFSTNPKQNE